MTPQASRSPTEPSIGRASDPLVRIQKRAFPITSSSETPVRHSGTRSRRLARGGHGDIRVRDRLLAVPGPRKKCDSFKVFERNVERSRAFLRLFDVDRTVGQPSNDEKELLRGTIVFAIGALDAFLHELVLEVVPKFGGNRSALVDALRAIAREDPGLALRLSLAPDDKSKEDEFRAALDGWLERKSFQGVERVVAALRYVGVGLTIEDFDCSTGLKTAERLDRYTKMRHDIVHRGQRPSVVRNNAQECVDMIAKIGSTVNQEAVILYNVTG